MEPLLPETLRRLDALIDERGLVRSELLDVAALAERTALDARTVRDLLAGRQAPADSVDDRVRSRLKALSDAWLARTGRPMSELAHRVSQRSGISAYWARLLCTGRKVPSLRTLEGLVAFFGVEGREAFFTAPADEALNRALLPLLGSSAGPPAGPEQEPLLALMRKHGVRAVDLRRASMTPEQLERVLVGVLHSVTRTTATAPGDGP
ncbi:hypothetical protein ACN20G_34885 (plasmid) [Streptomyces sp. BI20]|uniref:hypothetical protein n=1 Tax=Streptomyces sp. BI20 TaxID=3403460 RepID=UPI003C71FFA9